jgi:signal transduction histidine kinase
MSVGREAVGGGSTATGDVPAKRLETSFLDGGGELGALMRAFDWSATPLGAPAGWPRSLKTAVRIMLTSRQPIWLGWGPELTYLYNDAYQSIIGGKHPRALGRPFAEVWHEIRDVVGPMADRVMKDDEGTYVEAQLLIMERHGYQEETYYTFSYSPVPDDDGRPGGLICANTDDTRRVIGERRIALLRELAARTAAARSRQEACTLGVDALATNPRDVTFALVYVIDAEGRLVPAAQSAGVPHEAATARWPVADPLRTNEPVVVALDASFGTLPAGAWPRPSSRAAVLPIAAAGQGGSAGMLVVGLNPFRPFDEDYRGFLGLVAGQIAAGIADAQAYEEERRRAEALAQLDQAKTAFFSNVSHEFRTPLTLMLGIVDDLVSRPEGADGAEQRELLGVVQRNGVRLLKLVNTLLDFARIEAGRAIASFEATDLATLTAELASNFRSACERAGLALVVDCPPLREPAFVDREMWEKIVLNLVSNAFKFTLEGGITVALADTGSAFELEVRDTGAGIPEHELPLMFERFHRVEGVRGRSHEGSGIGLALVHELVKLHGGTIGVASATGRGTTFTVSIPKGRAHLASDRVRAPLAGTVVSRADAYVQEALSWLPAEAAAAQPAVASEQRARVVLADDNADLRSYARRLLAEQYDVVAVADGEQALAAVRAQRPDIVVSDVMMPNLDGFGLLRELRADPALRTVPVIMLSARAGEEARMEGLERGADDYLVKPFSSRELLVRVGALLHAARLRREVEDTLREADRRKDEFIATLSHELRNPLAPLRNALHILAGAGEDGDVAEQVRPMMERQVGHLVRLVDDLLDVSRINRGTFELRKERVDIATIVGNAVETSDPALRGAGHALSVTLPDAPLWIDGDLVRLSQVLGNLLNNAAKYTPPGGRIALEVVREGDAVVIRVRDNGAGISPAALPRLFEMFNRGDREGRGTDGGLGIGLALARRLAEMHGGRVDAASEGLGKGSEFTVRLPLASDQRPGAGGDVQAPAYMPRRRVLVVDDNRDAADSLGLVLGSLGADVRIARDGREALELFDAYRPSAVLLDIGMPGMDGYEVARRIRERSESSPPPLMIALTGWGSEEDRRRAAAAGFDRHLVKPADLGTLQKLLASLPGGGE